MLPKGECALWAQLFIQLVETTLTPGEDKMLRQANGAPGVPTTLRTDQRASETRPARPSRS